MGGFVNLLEVGKYFYPDRILDIGANTGQFHVLARETFPYSYIFSIEAMQECEDAIKQYTDQYYIGLLAKDYNEYDFYTRKDDKRGTGNSMYRELTDFYRDENLDVIKKQGIRLDDLFTDDSEFDLIKIDTQGAELDVMQGGMQLCSKAKGIILEVTIERYNENSPLIDEVNVFMDNLGFKPMEILETIKHPYKNIIIQHDMLYVNKSLLN
jgi:FkbM family methyltransferase